MGGPPLFLIVQREVRETSGHTPRLSMTVREHPRQPQHFYEQAGPLLLNMTKCYSEMSKISTS